LKQIQGGNTEKEAFKRGEEILFKKTFRGILEGELSSKYRKGGGLP